MQTEVEASKRRVVGSYNGAPVIVVSKRDDGSLYASIHLTDTFEVHDARGLVRMLNSALEKALEENAGNGS